MLVMEVTDYNGKGRWSMEAIRDRYGEHAARLGVQEPLELRPKEFSRGNRRWVYPLMDAVISGIEAGDQVCCILGVEFLEEDTRFSFGANLKSRCARALRRTELSQALAARLQRRIVAMLLAGNVPREYREYARLLRKLGFENLWPRIEAGVSRQNRYVMRYFRYFECNIERNAAPQNCHWRSTALGRHEPSESPGRAGRDAAGDRPRPTDRNAQHTCPSRPMAERQRLTNLRHSES